MPSNRAVASQERNIHHGSLIFFVQALVDMTLLCGTVAMLSQMYLPINLQASRLMAPCFLWTLYVAVFNYKVWRSNSGRA